ncbi:MAG: nucleotide pyrophosphohydrolase [Rhodocyclaceae bacterium]|nr:nucleotide pyrophosphohydrolase [Rhodocyclaceae bacterium]
MNQLEELRAVVREFVAERGWDRHHNPKNLAIALAVEAAEVLEHFQWCSEAESFALPPERRKAVADELSDVLMGVIRVADLLDIDLAEAFAAKMVENRAKYPPEKVRGRAIKYTEL